MKIYDQHVHTSFSFDSVEPIENYINKAIELELSYFVSTDHFDFGYIDKLAHSQLDISKQHEYIKKIQPNYKDITILKGIEIGYIEKYESEIRDILINHDFDIVNLSLHVMDGLDYLNPKLFTKYSISEILDNYFKDYKKLVNSGLDYDVCCHIDYGFKSAYLIDNSIRIKNYENELIDIFKDIIRLDKDLEINLKVQLPLGDEHTMYMLNLYKSTGGKNITLSSDAHNLEAFYNHFNYYISLIKNAGFNKLSYYINRKRYYLDI